MAKAQYTHDMRCYPGCWGTGSLIHAVGNQRSRPLLKTLWHFLTELNTFLHHTVQKLHTEVFTKSVTGSTQGYVHKVYSLFIHEKLKVKSNRYVLQQGNR